MRVGRSGAVLEPALGIFDVTVAPGEDLQAAIVRCPPGGCVLLLPGTHAGPLELGYRKEEEEDDDDDCVWVSDDKEVHVFGRGRASLGFGHTMTSGASRATIDGLVMRQEAGDGNDPMVLIVEGALRLQNCNIACHSSIGISIEGGTDPVIIGCTCVGVEGEGGQFTVSSFHCVRNPGLLPSGRVFTATVLASVVDTGASLHLSPLSTDTPCAASALWGCFCKKTKIDPLPPAAPPPPLPRSFFLSLTPPPQDPRRA